MSLSAIIGIDDFYLAGGSKPDLVALDFKTAFRINDISQPELDLLFESTAFFRILQEEAAAPLANNMIVTNDPASYAPGQLTAKKNLYASIYGEGVELGLTFGTVVAGTGADQLAGYAPGTPLYVVNATCLAADLWAGITRVQPQIYFVFHDYATEIDFTKAQWIATFDTYFDLHVQMGNATGRPVVPYVSPMYESAPWGEYLPTELWRHVCERLLAAYIAGDIDGFIILAGYEAPTIHSGTAQSGSTATTIKLANAASASDDAYNGYQVKIAAGTGSGQGRFVTDYVGATRVATVHSAWTTTPDVTSDYEVGLIQQVAWNASADSWLAVVLDVFGPVFARIYGDVA